MHHQLKSIPINRSHSSQSNVILAPPYLTISCLRVPRCETDYLAGVRGLELGNVVLRHAGPNSLVSQNIFVPQSFGQEPQRDRRGSRWGPEPAFLGGRPAATRMSAKSSFLVQKQ
jgi:hypothetical protein